MNLNPNVIVREKLSPHFYADEFVCRCGCGKLSMNPSFMLSLQQLREQYAKPMRITSGFRCKKKQEQLIADGRGAVDSEHVWGNAADIAMDNAHDRYRLIALAFKLGFTGIGVAKDFVHLDRRMQKLPVVWTYK